MEKKLRLKRDPQRVGAWSGKDEDRRERNGIVYLFVKFPNGSSWHADWELEEVTEQTETAPTKLFRAGNLSGEFDLRRAVMRVRLSGRLTDMIYSMEATNTDFYAYQFKPAVRLLHSPLNGILVADEVGLGKTIEAGIIWKELEARFDYRRLLVVCPASLREKWRDELKNKIGVSAQFADAAEVLENIERGDDFALICSHQGIRLPAASEGASAKHKLAQVLRDREGGEPAIDLLIIDEAHHMRNLHTQTRKTGRLLRLASHHVVLLTATPVHNKNEDLFSLLNLLMTDSEERPAYFENILEANKPLIELRDKTNGNAKPADIREGIETAMQNPLLRKSRQLKRLLDTLPRDGDFADEAARTQVMHRLETANLLGHCLTRTLKRDVQEEFKVVREPFDHPVQMGENESRFYKQISGVVAEYFGNDSDLSPADVLAMGVPHRMASSCMTAAYRRWVREDLDEQEEGDYWDDGESGAARAAGGIGGLTRDLCRHCQTILPAGFDQTLARGDSKYEKLRNALRGYFDGDAPKKAVLFSEFKGTLAYLEERLADDGVRGIVLKGGLTTGEKTDIVREFRDNPDVRVLLSSEVGGEGIDLQFAQLLINYDIPWNPMRLEQRIGRLDRLGQESDRIFIWNLYHEGTINEHVYQLLQGKLKLCQRTFGRMEPVLAATVKELTAKLLKQGLTEDQKKEQVERAARALEEERVLTDELEENAAHFVGLGDYILSQINNASKLNRRISSGDLRRYLGDFLKSRYPGSELKEGKKGAFTLHLGAEAFHDLGEFIKTTNTPQKTLFIRDLRGDITFVDKVAGSARGSAEPVSQYHPLIRFAARGSEDITPAVAVKIPAAGDLSPGVHLIAGALWSYRGAAQVSEKIAYAGETLGGEALSDDKAEKMINHAINHGEYWVDYRARLNCEAVAGRVDELSLLLTERFHQFVGDLRDEDNDRSEVQEEQILRHRQETLEFFDARIQKLEQEGKTRVIPAEKGKRQKFIDRIEARLVSVRKRREKARDSLRHIFVAAILVE